MTGGGGGGGGGGGQESQSKPDQVSRTATTTNSWTSPSMTTSLGWSPALKFHVFGFESHFPVEQSLLWNWTSLASKTDSSVLFKTSTCFSLGHQRSSDSLDSMNCSSLSDSLGLLCVAMGAGLPSAMILNKQLMNYAAQTLILGRMHLIS